ncbi:cytochrome b-245 chaperone 1 homolog isoform X4 [Oncorhynchus tshawytscha]|uniref:cytochrome b-245 chaperone 1 homolog isoform X4 n=1 Tax=Oncorhynchus tshawytscha TaxID=74940 RepID=UPI001C3E6771|nr:cytochrome b-245 chaperone 1 homolog isoform X4 [Oncorhynchus tshawytscha]
MNVPPTSWIMPTVFEWHSKLYNHIHENAVIEDMGYMQVEEHTTNMLHLKRSPGIRSWSLLIGRIMMCVFIFTEFISLNAMSENKLTQHLVPFLISGIASIGLAAAYYSSDSILWKLFYVTGCLFVAMQNMEEWEEAVFDKTKKVIELKTFSLYALILTMCRRGQEKVMWRQWLRCSSVSWVWRSSSVAGGRGSQGGRCTEPQH